MGYPFIHNWASNDGTNTRYVVIEIRNPSTRSMKSPISKMKQLFYQTAPDGLYAFVYPKYSNLHRGRDKISFAKERNCWKLENLENGRAIFVPSPKLYARYVPYLHNHETDNLDSMYDKYTVEGFCEVEEGDVIFDTGAFVGLFSLSVSSVGSKIVVIEPDEGNVAAIQANLASLENVEIIQGAAWNESGEMDIEIGKDPTEHSLLHVDQGGVRGRKTTDAYRIDVIAERMGLDKIDFLKVEAEGAEPEVLQGAENVHISKVAVDCSAERNGGRPLEEVNGILTESGFETRVEGDILFARSP